MRDDDASAATVAALSPQEQHALCENLQFHLEQPDPDSLGNAMASEMSLSANTWHAAAQRIHLHVQDYAFDEAAQELSALLRALA